MTVDSPEPGGIATVGVVGAGAIGRSWIELACSRGLAVVVFEPEAGAREQVAAAYDHVADAQVRFSDDLRGVARQCDLVFENGPERLEVKREILGELDRSAPAEVILASSTSGFMPSTLQEACAVHPGRVLVAHPFNPPHLVPLVEVVGGRHTDAATISTLMGFLRSLGKRPIRIRQELPGHVANRLQAALWREAYDLVGRGVVSVGDLDEAIASGPGLRWALAGPFATQHLSGGDGGIAHVLAHLGPPMVEWWADLGEPELTPELVERIVRGAEEASGSQDLETLRRRRDEALRELTDLKTRMGM